MGYEKEYTKSVPTEYCPYCSPPDGGITHEWQNKRYSHYRRDFKNIGDLERHLKNVWADKLNWRDNIPNVLTWKRSDQEVVFLYEDRQRKMPNEIVERPPL
jgi:hypothetical protein